MFSNTTTLTALKTPLAPVCGFRGHSMARFARQSPFILRMPVGFSDGSRLTLHYEGATKAVRTSGATNTDAVEKVPITQKTQDSATTARETFKSVSADAVEKVPTTEQIQEGATEAVETSKSFLADAVEKVPTTEQIQESATKAVETSKSFVADASVTVDNTLQSAKDAISTDPKK